MQKGVWLVRHGKTKLNSTNASHDFIRGWQDIPLDKEGEREGKALASFIDGLHPTAIYSSDLQRAKVIAEDAAGKCKCPLEVSKDFRPWGLGDFEGKPAKDVVPQLQSYIDSPDKRVPGGGESFAQFRDRVLGATRKVMAKQLSEDENLVILTHFRDLKLIEAWLKKGEKTSDIDAEVFAANDLPTGAVMLLYRERGKWKSKREKLPPKVGVKKPLQLGGS